MGNTTFSSMQKAIFNYIRCQNSLPEPVLLVYNNGKYTCGSLTIEFFRINVELRWKATLADLVLVDEDLTTELRFALKGELEDILEEQNEYEREKFIEEYNVKPTPGIVSDIIIEEPDDNTTGNGEDNSNSDSSNDSEQNSSNDSSSSNSNENSSENNSGGSNPGGNYFSPTEPRIID